MIKYTYTTLLNDVKSTYINIHMLTYFYYVFTDIGIRQKIYLDRDIYTANYTYRGREFCYRSKTFCCVLHVKSEKTLLLFDITVKLIL